MTLVRSLALSVLALATTLAAASAPASPPATTPAVSRPAGSPTTGIVEDPAKPSPAGGIARPNAGWLNRHNTFVTTAKAGHIDLYMEGDSITDFWLNNRANKPNWDKNLAPWKPGCFGISGDRTQNVLYRIENGEFDGVNPKVVVLLIGTNNLASNATYGENTVEDTAKGITAVVDAIHKKAPPAKIILMAIFPRNDPPPKARPDIWTRITQVNKEIAKLDDGGKTLKFLDINPQLADKDGKLLPGVMNADNLHPTDKGYEIWFQAMKPTLTQWLGQPPATAPAPPK